MSSLASFKCMHGYTTPLFVNHKERTYNLTKNHNCCLQDAMTNDYLLINTQLNQSNSIHNFLTCFIFRYNELVYSSFSSHDEKKKIMARL